MSDPSRSSSFPTHGVALLLAVLCACAGSPASAADEALPSIVERTAGLPRIDGLFTLYRDADRGKLWIELPAPDGDSGVIGRYLYVEGLLTGLGSNPVGLDRGQLGATRLIALRRVGGRILVEQQNTGYRAQSDDRRERAAVAESFASSVLWGGPIEARGPAGELLVDFTSFVVRDAHGVIGTLKRTGQGEFALDDSRSAVDLEATLVFPDNLELEALLTFRGADPGSHVREVAPDPESISLVQHHSIVRLPDDGYRPRRFDPRAGSFAVSFQDYAAPLDAPLARRWIVRHRLEKLHPDRARSPVREPIVYYVDPAAPEPVRAALIDGASWWAEAFDEAGFEDAFRVELLPAGAHPLDARYNVIQWVHRSTRGWSYGGGVIDPRSGEMVKGHVSLGSLRVRQDRRLFEGLFGTAETGRGTPGDPIELSLARLRQLSAHEVGHTLGLNHNFAASTYGRASVMDYPAPLIRVDAAGRLDPSDAYGTGVGAWDRHAIRFAYAEFPTAVDEPAELDRIVQDGLRRDLTFLTDADARPAGAAHPLANLWDNGADPIAELERVLRVRRIALDGFGERNIASGQPLALLQEVLATVYFHHRYQLEATVKSVGGLTYTHALRGDGQPPARPVAAARQRAALDAVLAALAPAALDLDEVLLGLLLPRPAEHGPNRELFGSRTAPVFDALGAAATASAMVVDALLQAERAARLVDQHRRDATLPGLEEVVEALARATFETGPKSARESAIVRENRENVVGALIRLAANPGVAGAVRSTAEAALGALAERRPASGERDAAATAHAAYLDGVIRRFLDRRWAGGEDAAPLAPPPGSPIGGAPAALACSFDSGL